MSITFACSSCGKSFTVDDKFAGKKGKCKQCGAVMPIPGTSPPVEDLYGFDEPPARGSLPAGIEEFAGGPALPRAQAASGGLYDPPMRKKKVSGGGAIKSIGRVILIVLAAFVGLGVVGVALKSMTTSLIPGLTSRGELEQILQERVSLNQQLAAVLAEVADTPAAQSAAPRANGKIRAITANLRRLKGTKGLKTDLEALKRKFLAPQEQASQQVLQQMVRIAAIAGAWDALNVQGALEELDREEKSIPGMSQVQLPPPASPILPPAVTGPESAPGVGPAPPPGFNPGPPPGVNRPRPGNRRGLGRPGSAGAGPV